ncbi:hypothetical protein [Bradyrhizobium sp.]|uniref:hypothetical protein n=1 Tax=Bradyrhizobium sp. TaxID=376 RepID=UPI003C5A0F1C
MAIELPDSTQLLVAQKVGIENDNWARRRLRAVSETNELASFGEFSSEAAVRQTPPHTNIFGDRKTSRYFFRLEFGELPHVDTLAMAQREKLPKIISAGPTFELDDQAPASIANTTVNAWNTVQPLEKCAFVALVSKYNARIHVHKGQERLTSAGHTAYSESRNPRKSLARKYSPSNFISNRISLQQPRERTPRHDEPGAERPDHPDGRQRRVRETDADVLAAGGAGR